MVGQDLLINCVMAKLFRLFVVLILVVQSVFAQNDTTIFEVPAPYAACEKEAARISEIIISLNIQQRDSIAALLVSWEHKCGTGEASARLDLLLAISEKSLNPAAVTTYYEQYLRKFHDRGYFTRLNEPDEYYEKHKGYWEFIPFRGFLDRWTTATAKSLLDSQAIGSDARLLCLLFAGETGQFSIARSSWEYRNSQTSLFFKEKYGLIYGWEVETSMLLGSWLPQGRMADVYHPSPHFSFQLSLPIVRQTRGHLGLGFTILQQKQPIRLLTVDTIVYAKTKVAMVFNGGLTQRFQLREKLQLDIGGDLAFNYIFTDQKRPATDPDYEETLYGIGALDLGLNAAIERRIGKRRSLGLHIGFHHVPYGFDRKLMTPLGNSYVAAGIRMRFW